MEENKEAEVPGEIRAVILREKKVACGDVNVPRTTDDQNKTNAPTVVVPFIVQRIVEDQKSRRRRRVRARMRRAKEKEKETKVESKEERQAGKASRSGDKEAGRETAREVRKEKRMGRVTKSRMQ